MNALEHAIRLKEQEKQEDKEREEVVLRVLRPFTQAGFSIVAGRDRGRRYWRLRRRAAGRAESGKGKKYENCLTVTIDGVSCFLVGKGRTSGARVTDEQGMIHEVAFVMKEFV